VASLHSTSVESIGCTNNDTRSKGDNPETSLLHKLSRNHPPVMYEWPQLLHSCWRTPRTGVFLAKLTVAYLVNKFLRILRSPDVHSHAHKIPFLAPQIQSTLSRTTCLRFVAMLHSHLHHGLLNSLSFQVFRLKFSISFAFHNSITITFLRIFW
jgi:hypothetical protein